MIVIPNINYYQIQILKKIKANYTKLKRIICNSSAISFMKVKLQKYVALNKKYACKHYITMAKYFLL